MITSDAFYTVEYEEYIDLELFFNVLSLLSQKGYIYIEFANNELLDRVNIKSLDRGDILDSVHIYDISDYYLLVDYHKFLDNEIHKMLYYGSIRNIFFLSTKKEVVLEWCDVGKDAQIFIDLNICEHHVRKFCQELSIYSYCVDLSLTS